MKITVTGTGYVGLVTGACLADVGNQVLCLDVDDRKKVAANLVADVDTHRHQPYANCFEPRHALRVHTNRESYVDIILCFKCKQLWCFDQDGNRVNSAATISDGLQPFLNSLKPIHLDDAGSHPVKS